MHELGGAHLFAEKVAEEDALVDNVGAEDGERKEQKGEHRLPQLDLAHREHGYDEVEPYVGEYAPRGGDEEDAQVLDAPGLALGHHENAVADDDEQVVGGAAHNRVRTEVAGLELVAEYLDDAEQDLGRRRAQRHQLYTHKCMQNVSIN